MFVFKARNVCVCSSAESEELAVHLYPGAVTVQGVLRRKTVLKEGKKPTVRTPHMNTRCWYTYTCMYCTGAQTGPDRVLNLHNFSFFHCVLHLVMHKPF